MPYGSTGGLEAALARSPQNRQARRMPPLLAAQLVFLLHLSFLAWVVFGALAALWRPRLTWLHLPALAWGLWIVLSHGLCPLTRIENHLLTEAGAPGYGGGFIEHYLVPLVYPPGLRPVTQTVLGAALLVWNLGLYALVIRRMRCRPRTARPEPRSP